MGFLVNFQYPTGRQTNEWSKVNRLKKTSRWLTSTIYSSGKRNLALADVQALGQGDVASVILAAQVGQQAAALPNQSQEPAAR